MKLKEEYATETRMSDDGYYVVSQRSLVGDGNDEVWLTKHQVQCLVEDMKEKLDIVFWGGEVE